MRRLALIAAALLVVLALSCARAAGDWVLDEEATRGIGGMLANGVRPELHLGADGSYTLAVRGKVVESGEWERSGKKVSLSGLGTATFLDDRLTLEILGQPVVLRKK